MSTVRKGAIDDAVRATIAAAAAKKSLKVVGMPFAGGDFASFAAQVLAALTDSGEAMLPVIEAGGESVMFAANVAVRRLFEPKGKPPARGARKKFADPVLKALAESFRAAGNEADARRLDEAYAKLK